MCSKVFLLINSVKYRVNKIWSIVCFNFLKILKKKKVVDRMLFLVLNFEVINIKKYIVFFIK